MLSRQPGLRWLIALLVIIGIAFALVGDWLWVCLTAVLFVVIVARERRGGTDESDDPDPDPDR